MEKKYLNLEMDESTAAAKIAKKMKSNLATGVVERLKGAKNKEDVAAIMAQVRTYKFISAKTLRKLNRIAGEKK